MKQVSLTAEEVLAGYDTVSVLYPHVPPVSLWRAWEYIGYRRYHLPEPILDMGCGDGQFFKLVWPQSSHVIGVDADPQSAIRAQNSGVYKQVYTAFAHEAPFESQSFASAFANCALEHMDHLPQVLENIYRGLMPGGVFLFSVVTEKFTEWTTLPDLIKGMGNAVWANELQAAHETYHHLVNPLPYPEWALQLETAGFEVLEHIPIVPELTSRLFLFLDNVWHIKNSRGEIGNDLIAHFEKIPNFAKRFRDFFAGVLGLESNWDVGSGAIFFARKPV